MTNLKTLQAYALKCADKLGIEDKPILRWHTKDDVCNMTARIIAHCHTTSETAPRGTICLNKKNPTWHSVREGHNTIAHEVTHLAVKSNHYSVTFSKRMVSLGVANHTEKRRVQATRKHHHICYSVFGGNFPNRVCHRICEICGKEVKE